MKIPVLWIGIGLIVYSCVGTDYLDDPKDPAILTNVTSASLEIGSTFQIEAVYYYNMWREEPGALLNYRSNNLTVASVDQSGLVTGKGRGQTQVTIIYPGEDTVAVSITVVGDSNDVAEVLLSSTTSSIDIGESTQIELQVNDLSGNPYMGAGDTIWSVSDAAVATIDDAGVLTGVGNGSLTITAAVAGVQSDPLPMMVGVGGRTGTFSGVGSYQATGTATLQENEGGQLILTLSEDFATSFALGTFAYLANSTQGTAVRAQGLEIAEITENGGKQYNITSIKSDVQLYDYQYVIILCKPASITFGYADLN